MLYKFIQKKIQFPLILISKKYYSKFKKQIQLKITNNKIPNIKY